jgi:PAS domain-containing protein
VKNEEEIEFAEDGHREIVETVKTPMYRSDGQLMGILGISRDITERKQAEEERVRLMSAIEQSSEIIEITDKDGIIHYVNPAFEKITGYTREEVLGKSPGILKSGEHDSSFYKTMWDEISSGEHGSRPVNQ